MVEKCFSVSGSKIEAFLDSSPCRNCTSRYQSLCAQRPRVPARAPHPFCLRQGAQTPGRAGVPQDTPASSTDPPRLSERSGLPRSEFRVAAPGSSTAAAPARPGSQAAGPPFFWVLFFGGAKKSTCAAGRTSRPTAPRAPASAHQQAQRPAGNQAPNQTLKLEAFSASSPVSTSATRYHFRYRRRKQAANRGRDLSPPKHRIASPPAPTG